MNNDIYEYLNYYKDYTFDEILFNQIDALIFSIIVYIEVKDESKVFSLKDLYNGIDKDKTKGLMALTSINILKIIYNSKRYKDLLIDNFEKHEDDLLQFGAMTLRYNNDAYIVYEGTNSSVSGWMENFMLSCKYPTLTQEYALKYLNKSVKRKDKRIYLCGHSKGGNLAMTSAMMCTDKIFNKIKKIYNFDGPGFRKKEYLSNRFKIVNKKTVNILPEGSLVGIILFNDNYHYIKANGIGFKQHYPTSWKLFGEFFIESNLIISSNKIKNNMDKSLNELKQDEMLKVLDEVRIFLMNNNSYEKGFSSLNFNDFKKMVYSINDVDESVKKAFIDIVKLIFNPDKKNK